MHRTVAPLVRLRGHRARQRKDPFQIVGWATSYFAGHDDPHFGQTFGLNTIGNLLGLVGVALIDRWYDLVISRSFKLIPECLEVSRRFGVGAGHAS